MINKLTKNKIIFLIVSVSIFAMVLHSCKAQEKNQETESEEIKINPKAIELNNKAVELIKEMKYDSALVLFYRAIKIDTSYYLPYSNMVGIYLERKQYDSALYASNKVVEVQPDLAEGWTYAGILYDSLGDSLIAKKYYRKSIDIFDERIKNSDKHLLSNQINRAFCLVLLGRTKEGKAELRKLKSAHPDNFGIDELLKIDKEDYIRQITGGE